MLNNQSSILHYDDLRPKPLINMLNNRIDSSSVLQVVNHLLTRKKAFNVTKTGHKSLIITTEHAIDQTVTLKLTNTKALIYHNSDQEPIKIIKIQNHFIAHQLFYEIVELFERYFDTPPISYIILKDIYNKLKQHKRIKNDHRIAIGIILNRLQIQCMHASNQQKPVPVFCVIDIIDTECTISYIGNANESHVDVLSLLDHCQYQTIVDKVIQIISKETN